MIFSNPDVITNCTLTVTVYLVKTSTRCG